jgi:hypothetical protein
MRSHHWREPQRIRHARERVAIYRFLTRTNGRHPRDTLTVTPNRHPEINAARYLGDTNV